MVDSTSQLYGAIVDGKVNDVEVLLKAGAAVQHDHVNAAWELDSGDSTNGRADKLKLLVRFGARFGRLLEDQASQIDNHESALMLQQVLELISSRNMSDDHLICSLEDSLLKRNYHVFEVLERYAPWKPSKDEVYHYARSIIDGLEPDRRPQYPTPSDFWGDGSEQPLEQMRALILLLNYELDDRDLCLLFSRTLQKRNLKAAQLLLDRGAIHLTTSCEFLSGFLTLAVQWGSMSVVKQIWRSMAIVQFDPDFLQIRLLDAVSNGNTEAALFLAEYGADPFAEVSLGQRIQPRLVKSLDVFRKLQESSKDMAQTEKDLIKAGPGEPVTVVVNHHTAAFERHTDFISFLSGISDASWAFADYWMCAFSLAVRRGHVEIARVFLDVYGVSDGLRSEAHHVPCVLEKAVEMQELLVDRGLVVV